MSPTASAPDRSVHVHIRSAGGYRFEASFPGLPGVAPLLMDEPPPLGGSEGPNPAAVLASAIGGCLAASLTFCLRRSHVEGTVDADVQADIARNAEGRFRVAGVRVRLSLEAPGVDAGRLERCKALFEDFCTVTESVRHGIPVTLTVEDPPSS